MPRSEHRVLPLRPNISALLIVFCQLSADRTSCIFLPAHRIALLSWNHPAILHILAHRHPITPRHEVGVMVESCALAVAFRIFPGITLARQASWPHVLAVLVVKRMLWFAELRTTYVPILSVVRSNPILFRARYGKGSSSQKLIQ